MWCFAEAVWETVVAVTRSPETRHVLVLASNVRVVSWCSSRPSAWPTFEHETQVRSHLC